MNVKPPAVMFVLTVISRLVRLPPLITRPFVFPADVLQPNPTEMVPSEVIVALVRPVIENWAGTLVIVFADVYSSLKLLVVNVWPATEILEFTVMSSNDKLPLVITSPRLIILFDRSFLPNWTSILPIPVTLADVQPVRV